MSFLGQTGKWILFVLGGVFMFPAWLLVLFVHEYWIGLIE